MGSPCAPPAWESVETVLTSGEGRYPLLGGSGITSGLAAAEMDEVALEAVAGFRAAELEAAADLQAAAGEEPGAEKRQGLTLVHFSDQF